MSVWSTIAGLVTPITKVVDDLHTSEEEKLLIKSEVVKLQNTITESLIGYESQLLESKSKIITAEAQGQSWIQRNWRPITMLTFLGLVVFDAFGVLPFRLAEDAWTLLQLGLTGYVVGRSVEKTAPSVLEALNKR